MTEGQNGGRFLNKSSRFSLFYLDEPSKDYRILVEALLGRLEV